MQIKDSKSLAQSGYAQKNEDVDAHKVLKKGWHDQNGFHCKLNVIQAYMKLYVMQG